MFKIFQKCHFSWVATNILEVHVHDNVIDFEKVFLKMLDYFRNFKNYKPFENFLLYSIVSILEIGCILSGMLHMYGI